MVSGGEILVHKGHHEVHMNIQFPLAAISLMSAGIWVWVRQTPLLSKTNQLTPRRGMSIAMQIILEPVKAQIALKVTFDMVKGGMFRPSYGNWTLSC